MGSSCTETRTERRLRDQIATLKERVSTAEKTASYYKQMVERRSREDGYISDRLKELLISILER